MILYGPAAIIAFLLHFAIWAAALLRLRTFHTIIVVLWGMFIMALW